MFQGSPAVGHALFGVTASIIWLVIALVDSPWEGFASLQIPSSADVLGCMRAFYKQGCFTAGFVEIGFSNACVVWSPLGFLRCQQLWVLGYLLNWRRDGNEEGWRGSLARDERRPCAKLSKAPRDPFPGVGLVRTCMAACLLVPSPTASCSRERDSQARCTNVCGLTSGTSCCFPWVVCVRAFGERRFPGRYIYI